MQPPPTAADLLSTVAELLDEHVVPALSGPVQHQTRVAASLVSIVERELRLGPEIDAAERATWVDLLAHLGGPTPAENTDLAAVRASVAERLRAGDAVGDDSVGDDTVVWDALMATVRADLRIAKPGHDSWDGD